MRYLAAVILTTVCFSDLVSAQVFLLPEREIVPLAESIFSGGGGPEKCGDYFLYTDTDSEVPFITLNINRFPSSDKENVNLLIIMMQKRNVRVQIDNTKMVPTAEVLLGPKLILRLNRADYEKAARCLPRPLGA